MRHLIANRRAGGGAGQLANESYHRGFSVSKSQYVYNKRIFFTSQLKDKI